MIATIDFSIFYSPTEAYGSVTGKIDVPDSVSVGDEVLVLKESPAKGFCGRLRVTSVSRTQNGLQSILIGLDDVVLESMEDAIVLTRELENQGGLFVDPYHT